MKRYVVRLVNAAIGIILVGAVLAMPWPATGQPPALTAAWVGDRAARVTWRGDGMLYRIDPLGGQHFLQAVSGEGALDLPTPGRETDATRWPEPRDTYVLQQGNVIIATARLGWRVMLPIVADG